MEWAFGGNIKLFKSIPEQDIAINAAVNTSILNEAVSNKRPTPHVGLYNLEQIMSCVVHANRSYPPEQVASLFNKCPVKNENSKFIKSKGFLQSKKIKHDHVIRNEIQDLDNNHTVRQYLCGKSDFSNLPEHLPYKHTSDL